MDKSIEAEIRKELQLAHSLVEQFLGIGFQAPEPYIGDEHRSRFIDISSLRDIVGALMILGMYDDEINGIFVPDRLTFNSAAERIFTFAHECVHAFSTQRNTKLKLANIYKRTQSKKRRTREKGYIHIAFCEGLATYIAVQACLQSGRNDLVEYAEGSHKELVDFFAEWTSPDNKYYMLMAAVYNADPSNWKEVIMPYLTGVRAGLVYYKYDLGYYFMRILQPDVPEILCLIKDPPSTVRHILYPEEYQTEKKLSA